MTTPNQFEILEMDITTKGAVIPNDGHILARGPSVAALSIDMRTKRGEVEATGSDYGIPCIYLSATDASLHTDRSNTGPTGISFPQFKGYTIWAADYCRYTVSICMLKNDLV